MNIKTLYNIKESIYTIEKERLKYLLFGYENDIIKRIDNKEVEIEINNMIEQLKNTKIKYLNNNRYLIVSCGFNYESYGKDETLFTYNNLTKNHIKN